MYSLLYCYRKLINWRWEIGFLDNTLEGIVSGEALRVHWVKLPFHNRWFADPFILDYNEIEIVLLCEEFSDELKKGRIARVVIDKNNFRIKSWSIVLELPTHLSFPRIYRVGGITYVHPENSANGCLTMYRYDQDKNTLIEAEVVCNEPLTDAVMIEHNGKDLLFSTYEPTPNGNVLSVYEKREGKYIKVDDIMFDNNCARMAGDFFRIGDMIYRPAQDCNGDYGRAVYIQETECDSAGHWLFRNVRRLKSPHPILKWGLHTFNHYNGLIVIDVKGPRYPIVGNILTWLSKLVKNLKELFKEHGHFIIS